MSPRPSIPVIDVAALFEGPSAARTLADAGLMAAAGDVGFFAASGLPADVPVGRREREELLRLFQLPESEIKPLWRQKFDASHENVYRGWFPLQTGFLTSKEGIDLGADVAYGASVVRDGDPLREATPLPREESLPGWHAAAARYYRAMERVGLNLMRSIARGLEMEETFFDGLFERGLSTLRLIRYPLRSDLHEAAAADPRVWIEHRGSRLPLVGAPHVDSGFLTLLAQDGVPGLQARHHSGEWLDVPPTEGCLAVNFGAVLERLTGGRIQATQHRVVSCGSERKSIPFFYEPRADAEFRPLPPQPADAFEPFFYGDHVWATTTKFIEFKGMEPLRKPLRS